MAKKLTKKATKTLKNMATKTTKVATKGRVITVKNAQGDPDTTATILVQNKINYTPKVSVIIPVYNVEQYLRECLDSVCNQTLKEIEIICVDDGSTDSSLDILKEYAQKDNRITVMAQENLHAGVARNAGLAVAKGEYVHFLDSDDWVEKDIYEYSLKDIKENDTCIYMFNFNEYDNVTHDKKLKTPYKRYSNVFDLKSEPSILLRPVVPWNKLYKRSFIEKYDLKFDSTTVANDRTFYFKMLFSNQKITGTSSDNAFINYRVNNKSSLVGEKRLHNFNSHFISLERSLAACTQTCPEHAETIIDLFMLDCIYFYKKADDKQKKYLEDILSNYFKTEQNFKNYDLRKFNWYEFYKTTLKKDNIIPVVFATNDLYSKFVPVTIHSIMAHANKQNYYAFYVFHSGLSEESKETINSIYKVMNGNYDIFFINVKERIDSSIYSKGRFSIEMWYRIFIPEILSKYDKVLYLDCDLIACKDIAELYNQDISDNYLGVCKNYVTESYNRLKNLNINPDKYFNSGVLLFNNVQWNKLKLREKCFETAKLHPGLDCPDQDVLNMVCNNKVVFCNPKWNFCWQFLFSDKKPQNDDLKEYEQTQKDLGIIHYTSGIKPWNKPCYRYANIWWRHACYSRLFDYKVYLQAWYEGVTGNKIDLGNPQTFNEKIQWSKIYDSTPIKTRLADKFLVRDWVAEKIGEKYLIPLLGVYNSFDEIDFDKLPNQFVIKTNHGSATNIIVKDKSKLNLAEVKTKLDNWMAKDFSFVFGCELHYRDIPRKIIIEQYMDDGSGDLRDYKFTCFNGKPEFVWIDSDRHTEHKRNVYDLQWNQMNAKVNTKYDTFPSPEKPKCFDEMVYLAKKLSTGFNYVRVDFYIINDKVYFGEMTFTTSSGTEDIWPASFEKRLYKKFKLPKLAYNIDTGKYYKLPKQPKVKAQHKPVLIKPYLLFPYYLLSSFYLRHIKLPILKFNKHTKEVLYSHSARGRMDKILQSVQSVKDSMQNQINIVKAQQNDLIKQVNNNIAGVKQNSEKQISGLSDNIKKVENSVLFVNNQTSETQELFDSKLAETQELFDSRLLETNDKLSEIQNEFMADIDTLSEQIDTKASDLYKKIEKVSDNFKVISERLNNSEKILSDKITNVVDAKHKELSDNITKTAAAQNTDTKRIENAVVDVKNQMLTFEKNSLNSVNNIVSKLDSNKQELNTNIEKDRILYFNPWSTAVNTERGNCDITSAPDFENRFKKLISGLSAESAETVVKIIRRLQLIKGTNSKLDLFTKEEKDLLQRVRDFDKERLKVSDNLYAYKNYLLPINHFEPSVFIYNHGIEKLNTIENFKDKDILDVGGFIGDSVLMLSPLTNKKIYSFEAMKENFDLMQKTIELNGIKNAVPVNAAVGDKPGEIEIRFNGSASSQNDIMVKDPKYIEKCQVIKMDDYVREHNINVGLIKVDIEGAEQSFLRGAKETICKYKPTLLISIYHNIDDFLDIKPLIESWNLGYKFKVFKPVIESVSGETLLICEQ